MSEVLDKHSRMPRKQLATGELQERAEETGQFMPIPQERKESCIADLEPMLSQGFTLDQIAAKHQIHPRTLDFWIAGMPEEYRQIVKRAADYRLVEANQMMRSAADPFQLAKGRELGRMAMWWAERRDPERYADKRELTIKNDEPSTPEAIREKIGQLEKRLGIRVIEAEKQPA